MSLLFIALVESDYPSFEREFRRDLNELDGCTSQVFDMHSRELLTRYEQYISQVTGKPFTVANAYKWGIEIAIRLQFPNAKPGEAVTLQMDNLKFSCIVGENLSFAGQTIEQIAEAFGRTTAEVESFLFKQQTEGIGSKVQPSYLDISSRFQHPLSDVKKIDGRPGINLYAFASGLLQQGYLQATNAQLREYAHGYIRDILGADLHPEIAAQLRDRHLPTLMQTCTNLVEKMIERIENGQLHI